jgi:flagellar hook-length control protein FliK
MPAPTAAATVNLLAARSREGLLKQADAQSTASFGQNSPSFEQTLRRGAESKPESAGAHEAPISKRTRASEPTGKQKPTPGARDRAGDRTRTDDAAAQDVREERTSRVREDAPGEVETRAPERRDGDEGGSIDAAAGRSDGDGAHDCATCEEVTGVDGEQGEGDQIAPTSEVDEAAANAAQDATDAQGIAEAAEVVAQDRVEAAVRPETAVKGAVAASDDASSPTAHPKQASRDDAVKSRTALLRRLLPTGAPSAGVEARPTNEAGAKDAAANAEVGIQSLGAEIQGETGFATAGGEQHAGEEPAGGSAQHTPHSAPVRKTTREDGEHRAGASHGAGQPIATQTESASDTTASRTANKPAGEGVFVLERAGAGSGPARPGLATATATSARPSASGAGAAQGDDAVSAVSRGLSAAVLQKGGSLTLRLTPESLGQVRIDMQLERGSVAVRLEAATAAAHELLDSTLTMLRSSLESKGLSVERLSVHLAPGASAAPAPSGAQDQQATQQDGGQRSQTSTGQDAGGGASRGKRDHDPDQMFLFDEAVREADAPTFNLRLSTVA